MCWKCDHPDATMSEWLQLLCQKVKKNGWAAQFVESDRRRYAYTIGLHQRGLPELLVTGMSPERANLVLEHRRQVSRARRPAGTGRADADRR